MRRQTHQHTSLAVPNEAQVAVNRPRIRTRRLLPSFAFVAAMGLVLAIVVAPNQVQQVYAAGSGARVKAQTLELSAAQSVVAINRDNYTVTTKKVPVVTAVAVSLGAPAVGVPNPGTAQEIALQMLTARGWGADQYACLVSLFNRESGWNVYAANSSGAYGIPQALPGSKMASAGADWATNPATQIAWGLSYITGRYQTPCGAWAHSQAIGWY